MYSRISLSDDIDVEVIAPLNIEPKYSADILRDVYDNSLRANLLYTHSLQEQAKRNESESGHYRMGGKWKSYYLNGRLVSGYFSILDLNTIKDIPRLDNTIYVNYFMPNDENASYSWYGMPFVSGHVLNFRFIDEIVANLNCCRSGKRLHLDYKKYREAGEIRLKYLKSVYNELREKTPDAARVFGQLAILLEKEYARL